MIKIMQQLRGISAGLVVSALAGCMVGPDFERPVFVQAERYTAYPLSSIRLTEGGDVTEPWWQVFGVPELNQRVEYAWKNNPGVEQAHARLIQAEEAYRVQAGQTYYPAIDGGLDVKRQQIDPATMGLKGISRPAPFTVYDLGVTVSYALDFFGGLHRTLEAMQADVDLRRYEEEASYQLLAANVTLSAIRQASLQVQTEMLRDMLAVQQVLNDITIERHRLGGVSELEINTRQSVLAGLKRQLAQSEAQQAMTGHLLAIYLGETPDQAMNFPVLRLDQFSAPDVLPVALPSELVRRRPDIRASEAVLQRATAQVGVATADLFPRFTLGASASMADVRAGDVLGGGVDIWQFGLGVVQPLFHGGALQAQKRQAEAFHDEALARYREAVLHGLHDVADGLQAVESGHRTLEMTGLQLQLAEAHYRIIVGRHASGGVSHAEMLEAEYQYLVAALAYYQAEGEYYLNIAGLLHALGGGWIAVTHEEP